MKQNSILNLNKKQLKKIQKSLQDTAYGPTEFSKNKPLSYGETHDDIMCKNKNTLVGINGFFSLHICVKISSYSGFLNKSIIIK